MFAGAKYGMSIYGPAGDDTAAGNGAVTTAGSHVATMNPENPVVWLLGIAAATLGLIGFSTHVRVGPARAGVDLGTP